MASESTSWSSFESPSVGEYFRIEKHSEHYSHSYYVYDELIKCESLGCNLCSAIIDAVRYFHSEEELKAAEFNLDHEGGRLKLRWTAPERETHLQFYTEPGEPSISFPSWDSLNFLPVPGPVPEFRAACGNHTAAGFEHAERWIDECLNHENSCQQKLDTMFFPHRVLDLQGDLPADEIKLLESQNEIARYACLSHCWGDSRCRRLTTTSTLQTNKERIPLMDLPKTFRDAVFVARKLRIRYLWIDSLCIIQDSERDWQTESAQMADIFANAHLTIAATAAASDDEGFLSDVPEIHRARQYQVETTGGSQKLNVRRLWHYRGDPVLPLLTRAWCYQERMLSRRILHFAKEELWWECRSSMSCECGRIQKHQQRYGVTTPNRSFPYINEKARMFELAGNSESWNAIVSSYSALNLSMPKDKQPALSGIARTTRSGMGDEYVAGLWKKSLKRGLCWRRSTGIPESSLKERPRKWQAPSWSWSSINSAVTWDDVHPGESLGFEIIDVWVVPKSKDPYGELEDGHIMIKGNMSPAIIWTPTGYSDTPWRLDTCDSLLHDTGSIFTPDCLLDIKLNGLENRVFKFRLDEPGACLKFYGIRYLVLERTCSKYRRLGIVRVMLEAEPKGFGNEKECIISIE